MQLFAYNPIGHPEQLLVWVGILGVACPPPISFEIVGERISCLSPLIPFEPLGDEERNSQGQFLNHRAVFSLPRPQTRERFDITVLAGDEKVTLTAKCLPLHLPDKTAQSFNLLLSSCYYQPNDKAQPLADIISTIKPAPDFTLLGGDQVYLDLPSHQNLPKERFRLAQTLGKKYKANWFSGSLRQPGLANILRHGPVLCIADDHEFWNNYPLFQAQLNNTYHEQDRKNWSQVATDLYQRYQMSPAQVSGFFRRDIMPLSMLFLDGRTQRDAQGKQMFNAQTHIALDLWKKDLLECKRNKQPIVGLLSSGQALMIEKPGYWDRHVADMEMVNYEDFSLLRNTLNELFMAEIPVIYLTGDVHWGRIIEGNNSRGKPLFYEIIASPSRLIDTLGHDQISRFNNAIKGLFSKPKSFPTHPETPKNIPDIKLSGLSFEIKHKQQGDHVALLKFHACHGGLEFSVDYICTDQNDAKRREYSFSCGPFKLVSV